MILQKDFIGVDDIGFGVPKYWRSLFQKTVVVVSFLTFVSKQRVSLYFKGGESLTWSYFLLKSILSGCIQYFDMLEKF